ncbi:hypothetical protein [Clostridium lundense]|nr:hypothetical protein [Clostridium lundense]
MLEGNIDELKLKAKQMLIDGKTLDEIRRETKLRQKDIRRIQKEITAKF